LTNSLTHHSVGYQRVTARRCAKAVCPVREASQRVRLLHFDLSVDCCVHALTLVVVWCDVVCFSLQALSNKTSRRRILLLDDLCDISPEECIELFASIEKVAQFECAFCWQP
jgi:hypothetical protein